MSNPTSWKIIQAHQKQADIGWEAFTNGLIANTWIDIQRDHYTLNPVDGENIHRWRRMVIQQLFDVTKELWTTRCGYIHAEKTMTERDMLSHRTAQLFRDNHHLRDSLSILDRHLFDKDDKYFYTSSQATLELWETRVTKVLKNRLTRDQDQPSILASLDAGGKSLLDLVTAANRDKAIVEQN